MNESQCVDEKSIKIEKPSPLKVNCESGIVVSPPPRNTESLLLRLSEIGEDKFFSAGVYGIDDGVLFGDLNMDDRARFWQDYVAYAYLPGMGPSLFLNESFYLVFDFCRYVDQVWYPGKPCTPSFVMGGLNHSNWGYWKSPGAYSYTYYFIPATSFQILVGTRDYGRFGFIPKGLKNIGPNQAYITVPNAWHGGGDISVESWSPFRATFCVTNNIKGHPDYTQVSSGYLFDPLQFSWAGAYGPGNEVGLPYSTHRDKWSGCTAKFLLEEVPLSSAPTGPFGGPLFGGPF